MEMRNTTISLYSFLLGSSFSNFYLSLLFFKQDF